MSDNIDLTNFINRTIPTELADKLKYANRVIFETAKTELPGTYSVTEDDFNNSIVADEELDDLVDHVVEMEKLVEDLEDLLNQYTKDMKIEPSNDSIRKAAKQLGSVDGTITKEVLETALANMDYLPLLSMGTDPVLAALVGDGSIDIDKSLKCNEIAYNLANEFKDKLNSTISNYKDDNSKIQERWENQQKKQVRYILLSLFWNMLWGQFIVDMIIINPLRNFIAKPTDTLLLFFYKLNAATNSITNISYPEKKRFRKANDTQLINAGPLNMKLTAARKTLLCLPYKIFPDYDPLDIPKDPYTGAVYNCMSDSLCPQVGIDSTDIDDDASAKDTLEQAFKDISSGIKSCTNIKDLISQYNDKINDQTQNTNCSIYAKKILDAVIEDALTPYNGVLL